MEYITHRYPSGKTERLYKTYCKDCSKDNGYTKRHRIGNLCSKCVGKRSTASKIGKTGPNKGKIFSKETKQKMAKAKLGCTPWNKGLKEERYEVRLKLSLAKLGVVPWNKGSGNTTATEDIKRLVRYRTRKFIKGSPKHQDFVVLAGCTREELIKHIERKFLPEMTWKNWTTTGWHIDHIKPLASFDLSDIEQLKKACHYSNLQPLWAEDNLKKGNK